jgi:dTDP-4-amino-4,6-dideoxygalactose transaminase
MRPVEFVERKPILWAELERIMAPSVGENRHTNFGPVAEKLEGELQALNGANPARIACCAANGTLALQAAVAAFENFLGRRLRWAVTDFGFFTNFIGPFVEHIPIPCKEDGMISLANLRAISLECYDAVLATNVFGLHEQFDEVFAFCRQHGKILLIDNAGGFRALAPHHAVSQADDPLLWAEVVSFHHTKPWGMGEGGVAFLPQALERRFRSAINFGVGEGQRLTDVHLCTNGKMSEITAAQILSRVLAHDDWVDGYRKQARRILMLGKAAGLQALVDTLPTRAVPGQIGFLCSRAVAPQDLSNPHFTVLKYYPPGRQSGPTARLIFDRVVNLPCHPGMVSIDDKTILDVLCAITRPS